MLIGFKSMIPHQQLKIEISRHIKFRTIATQLSYSSEHKGEQGFKKIIFKFDKSDI